MDDEIGTIEWFRKELWSINPINTGTQSLETSYFYASRSIGDTLYDGSEMTWEMLQDHYRNYYNYMITQQAGKYTKKENVLLSVEDYCVQKKYKSDYSKIQENECDAYLFGI